MLSNKKRRDLINMLCRICAREDLNSIPIFGDDGRKQNLVKKIKACLPVDIHESDALPKRICLTCLTKLDSFWDMHVLCKEAQIKIEERLALLKNQENLEQDNSSPSPEDANCGVCNQEVHYNQKGVLCDGHCKKWYHAACIKMSNFEYFRLVKDEEKPWFCTNCRKTVLHPKTRRIALPIEEKLKGLSASYPVSYGDSAVICLAPASSPPPLSVTATATREAQVLPQAGPTEPVMAPVTYLAPAPAPPAVSTAAPPPATEEVYPRALIQVPQSLASEQHVVYQSPPVPAAAPAPPSVPRRRPPVLVPKPMASPTPATTTQRSSPATTTQRATPAPVKRENGDTSNGPDVKKLCIYCNKYFTDDIIDHHVSLHLRQTFSSCVECGKNFRSEEAMQRHRCGDKKDNETIDLDADDDEPIIL